MKLIQKLRYSFGLMVFLVLAAGTAGWIAFSRLGQSVDFIAGPAWATADATMESAIDIEAQMLAVRNLLSGREEEASLSQITGRRRGIAARLVVIRQHGLLDGKGLSDYEARLKAYETHLDGVVKAYGAFRDARRDHTRSCDELVRLGRRLEAVGDAVFEGLEATPDLTMSWNTGLSGRWAVADGAMEANIGLLLESYRLERLFAGRVAAEEHKSIREAVAFHEDAINAMSGGGDVARHFEEGKGTEDLKAYRARFTRHKELLDRLLTAFVAYAKAEEAYSRSAGSFLEYIETLDQSIGDGVVDDEVSRLSSVKFVSIVTLLVPLVLSVLLGVAIGRSMTNTIRLHADLLDGTASLLLASSQEQQAGANEQAGAVEETKRTLTELLESARTVSDTSHRVFENAEVARQNAGAIAGRIGELSRHTEGIGEILSLIKDIANKSELLALNAGLEGAKAGEAGRGFSLVAGQMQRLSEQVMDSVKDIARLTSDISRATNSSVLASEEATKVASETADSAQQISFAVQQQQTGTEQVVTAMDQINVAARDHVESARQLVEISNQLIELAASLDHRGTDAGA